MNPNPKKLPQQEHTKIKQTQQSRQIGKHKGSKHRSVLRFIKENTSSNEIIRKIKKQPNSHQSINRYFFTVTRDQKRNPRNPIEIEGEGEGVRRLHTEMETTWNSHAPSPAKRIVAIEEEGGRGWRFNQGFRLLFAQSSPSRGGAG